MTEVLRREGRRRQSENQWRDYVDSGVDFWFSEGKSMSRKMEDRWSGGAQVHRGGMPKDILEEEVGNSYKKSHLRWSKKKLDFLDFKLRVMQSGDGFSSAQMKRKT